MPIIQTLKIYRGETVPFHWSMSPNEDITGWVISMTVARAFNIAQKLFQVTATITNGSSGKFDTIVTRAQTQPIEPGTYVFDLWRVNPGLERILSAGQFILGENAKEPT